MEIKCENDFDLSGFVGMPPLYLSAEEGRKGRGGRGGKGGREKGKVREFYLSAEERVRREGKGVE